MKERRPEMNKHLHPVKSIASVAALLAMALASAAPAPPAVRAEIDALLNKLEMSNCQFNRNGDWYSGAEAKKHLAKKLAVLESKSLIKTTEDFIGLGAASSSSTGRLYLVRCEGAEAIQSQMWLHDQLRGLRQTR
jgi:Family of unknown function (DUF5329)